MKVVITIQDKEDGNVRVTSEPNCRQMAEEAVRKRQKLTPAQIYALKAMEAIVALSRGVRKHEDKNRIITPDMFN
jgi:hypothetical protein